MKNFFLGNSLLCPFSVGYYLTHILVISMKHLISTTSLLMAGVYFTATKAQNLSPPTKNDYSRWSLALGN